VGRRRAPGGGDACDRDMEAPMTTRETPWGTEIVIRAASPGRAIRLLLALVMSDD